MDARVGLNLDATSNVLDSLDGLEMRDPQVLTAERFSPAFLVLLLDEHAKLIDQAPESVDVLLAVAYVDGDLFNHLEKNPLSATRQARHDSLTRDQKLQQSANVLEPPLISNRRSKV